MVRNSGERDGRAERRRRKEIERSRKGGRAEEERKRGESRLEEEGVLLPPFPPGYPTRAFQFQKKTTLTWNGMEMAMRKMVFFSKSLKPLDPRTQGNGSEVGLAGPY